jgi:hypothetical protein
MNVPPAVMGPLMRLQASGVGNMFAGVSQQIRPWTTDFGASPEACCCMVRTLARKGLTWCRAGSSICLAVYKARRRLGKTTASECNLLQRQLQRHFLCVCPLLNHRQPLPSHVYLRAHRRLDLPPKRPPPNGRRISPAPQLGRPCAVGNGTKSCPWGIVHVCRVALPSLAREMPHANAHPRARALSLPHVHAPLSPVLSIIPHSLYTGTANHTMTLTKP